MKTFKELEADYANMPIGLSQGRQRHSGYLKLDGNNTHAALVSRKILNKKVRSDGWFDLELTQGTAEKILLHNAVSRGQRSRGGGKTQSYQETIVPNVVAVNAQNIPVSGKVNIVNFKLEGSDRFFLHQLMERHSLHKAPPEILAMVQELRKFTDAAHGGKFPRSYGNFSPRELYLVHDLYKILEVRVGHVCFRVGWWMETDGPGNTGIHVSAEPIATIAFDKLVSMDDALEQVWIWQRYFQQLAMQELPIEAISLHKGTSPFGADVYIPYLREKEHRSDYLHAGDLPLSRYEDREAFAACMQTWLEKQDSRGMFRGGLNYVLTTMSSLVSVNQIMNLCAALESLPELNQAATMTEKDVASLVGAAEAHAEKEAIKVDAGRLAGVLKSLLHTSLPKRMKLISAALEPHISKKQSKLVFDTALMLRNNAAHGTSADYPAPRVAPTVQGFVALLVLYDLVSCGVPTEGIGKMKILAIRKAKEAIFWLEQNRPKVSDA